MLAELCLNVLKDLVTSDDNEEVVNWDWLHQIIIIKFNSLLINTSVFMCNCGHSVFIVGSFRALFCFVMKHIIWLVRVVKEKYDEGDCCEQSINCEAERKSFLFSLFCRHESLLCLMTMQPCSIWHNFCLWEIYGVHWVHWRLTLYQHKILSACLTHLCSLAALSSRVHRTTPDCMACFVCSAEKLEEELHAVRFSKSRPSLLWPPQVLFWTN